MIVLGKTSKPRNFSAWIPVPMQIKKVKVFSEDSAQDLEQVINDWLAANPNIEVVEVLQSQSSGFPVGVTTLTLSIVYSTTQPS
jgi:hypothetical protein